MNVQVKVKNSNKATKEIVIIDLMTWYLFFPNWKISTLVDCQWGNWIHGECSKTCGGGVQTNQRKKITEALFGGEECVGEATEEKECNVQECCEYHFAREPL